MNNKIKETYCSFDVCKLLKEKGAKFIPEGEDTFGYVYAYKPRTEVYRLVSIYTLNFSHDCQQYDYVSVPTYDAPTLSMAAEWLRINYDVFIEVKLVEGSKYNWQCYEEIKDIKEPTKIGKLNDVTYNTPQEALEQGILHALKDLI